MIVIYTENGKKIDERHTVDIHNSYSFSEAVQLNSDGTYDTVMYMEDDVRTYNNEAIIDATEEELEQYRKIKRRFQVGDTIIISRGRKMKGEIKQIKSSFVYTPKGTYGHCDVNYLVFTDGTKVNSEHCDFIMER